MKLINKCFLIFLIIFCSPIAICQIKSKKAHILIKNLTINDSGKKIVLSKGDYLVLKLKNHVDGGYVFNYPQFDRSILTLSRHEVKKQPINSPLGASGSESWLFRAFKKGKTKLKITSSRPWMKKDSVLTFSDEVIIK